MATWFSREYSTVNPNNSASEPSLSFNINGDKRADAVNDDDIIVIVSRALPEDPGIGTFLIHPLPNLWDHEQWVNFIATVNYDEVDNSTTLEVFYGDSIGNHTVVGRPDPCRQCYFGTDNDQYDFVRDESRIDATARQAKEG